MSVVDPPSLDARTALRVGGYPFGNVLDLMQNGRVGAAIIDSNNDDSMIVVEEFWLAADGWSAGSSGSAGSFGYGVGRTFYIHGEAAPHAVVRVRHRGVIHERRASESGWWVMAWEDDDGESAGSPELLDW